MRRTRAARDHLASATPGRPHGNQLTLTALFFQEHAGGPPANWQCARDSRIIQAECPVAVVLWRPLAADGLSQMALPLVPDRLDNLSAAIPPPHACHRGTPPGFCSVTGILTNDLQPPATVQKPPPKLCQMARTPVLSPSTKQDGQRPEFPSTTTAKHPSIGKTTLHETQAIIART